ncbi:MAG TPA: hypothetical protein VHT70_05420 [Candidatus Saccharimonadales bacterium]|jgi:hypothetical protein|nr:hypothetical protein [Candidatus Saccharimonadales bacterium]
MKFNCLNDPGERYSGYHPENYRGCGVLGAAQRAVEAASEELTTESPALTFYKGFFTKPE